MPAAAEIVHTAMHDGVATLWVLLDSDDSLVTRRFYLAATGADMPSEYAYRGTVFEAGIGTYVWHVIEQV